MKINEIISFADEIAPFDTAEEWDNVGLLVGSESTDIKRVLLALDITIGVVEEAREKDCGLIVSHHPVIFSPIGSISPDSAVYKLIKYGIAALCLHTDLDRAENGVNTALADALGLKNAVLYPEDFMVVGDTENTYTADDYAAVIKERLNAPSVRYTSGKVSKVAVSSGGGGEGVELAEKYGFDAFVTGELKHHQYIFAVENGIAAFDAGHFPTEDVVIKPLCDMFRKKFPDAEFIISQSSACPYKSV